MAAHMSLQPQIANVQEARVCPAISGLQKQDMPVPFTVTKPCV